MNNDPNQPSKFDAVLGSQIPPPIDGIVLGGIEGVKYHLKSSAVKVQVAALSEAINYGNLGLELVVQALKNQSLCLRRSAYSLLKFRSETWVKEAIEAFNSYELLHCDRTINTGFKPVHSLAISSDSHVLVCGGGNNPDNARTTPPSVWNLRTGELFLTLHSYHTSKINQVAISRVAISRDGQRIISAGNDNSIVWDVKTCRKIYNLKAHFHGFYAIAIHPDEKTLFSAGGDRAIRIWNLQSGQETGILEGFSGRIFELCITANGNLLISGGDDGTIRVWDIRARRQVWKFGEHSQAILSLAISPDGQTLVSGSDQRIKVWNLQKRQEIFSFYGHANWVRTIVFSPDSKAFLTAGDPNIKVWDASTGKKIYSFKGHSKPICSLALSYDGRILVSGSVDGTVKVWRF